MTKPRHRWDALRRLCEAAESIGGMEVWLFGSALRVKAPRDIDVLIVYTDAYSLLLLREFEYWDLVEPPIDLMAMMPDEVIDLRFIEVTSAIHIAGSEGTAPDALFVSRGRSRGSTC